MEFKIVPKIISINKVDDFFKTILPTKEDIVFINNSNYVKYQDYLKDVAYTVNMKKYGKGEPNDLMVEAIYEDIKNINYKRVIAIGGGSVLDVAKLFVLDEISPIENLFQGLIPLKRTKELILVPTTCGTGSEVTNISILELTKINVKMGLAKDELFADSAYLVSEFLNDLPLKSFAASAIDALIHAVESYTSNKASEFSKMYSQKALKDILDVFVKMKEKGHDERLKYLDKMMLASTMAGIAFGNAGCGPVHALSYPLGAKYHIPHGESNYAIFTGVYKKFLALKNEGALVDLNTLLSQILNCSVDEVYEKIEEVLNYSLPKKHLSEYGMTKEEIDTFSDIVIAKQQRLMNNSFTPLSKDDVKDIYQALY